MNQELNELLELRKILTEREAPFGGRDEKLNQEIREIDTKIKTLFASSEELKKIFAISLKSTCQTNNTAA